jgi:hypothetical protein
MENFDDLFNKFLGKDDENRDNNEFLNNEAKKIIDMIDNFKNINPTGAYTGEELDKLDDELDNKLGEPDDIEYSTDGEMYFEKRMWYKPLGVIIKTLVSDEPLGPIKKEPEMSLHEQLEKAVAIEDYELAAELRDKIKKAIAKEKRRLKKLNT